MGKGKQATLRLLGLVQIDAPGQKPFPRFRSQRTQTVLAYLVTAARPVSREVLCALFWPETGGSKAKANLRRELHNLNRILPGCWENSQISVHFSPTPDTRVDLYEVERLIEADEWVEACGWLRGAFLEGVILTDSLEAETWLRGERERWRQHSEEILQRAAQAFWQAGNSARARSTLVDLIRLSPWHEGAHRQLMLLFARQGNFSGAIQQFRQCQELLEREMAVAPSAETRALHRRIKAAAARPPGQLPAAAAPFVGREEEIALLRQRLLDPNCRLLTITGLGGTGKSRLALEAVRPMAQGSQRRFLHGVSLVPLAGSSASEVPAAIATAVGITFQGPAPAERQLVGQLAERELLLLLDNYEHLLPQTRLLQRILAEAPGVTLLVTSRRRLALEEEWVIQVEGLPQPPLGASAEQVSMYASVQLFAGAARRVSHLFDPAPHALEIADLCRLVQGMPLALLLAAPWLESYAPGELVHEIGHSLALLETRYRNTPARQRSVQAVFAATWEQMEPRLQQTVAALSVFRGSFTARAASEVAGASSPLLTTLCTRSLLQRQGETFTMHELLRHYAAEKLAQNPSTAQHIRESHAHYYLAQLAEAEAVLFGMEARTALKTLEPARNNLLAAWEWAVAEPDDEKIRRAVRALSRFFRLLGPLEEGQALLQQAVERLRPAAGSGEGEVSRHTLLHVLLAWGNFLIDDRSFALMAEVAAEVVAEAQEIQSPSLESAGHLLAGTAHYNLRQNKDTLLHLTRAVSLAEAAQATRYLAQSLRQLGMFVLLREDDFVGGVAYLERALLLSREIGDAQNEAASLNGLGIAHITRDYGKAVGYLQQTAALYRRLEDGWGEGIALINLGHMALTHGELARAQTYNRRTLTLKRKIGDRQGEGIALVNLSLCAHLLGEEAAALRYAGEALAVAAALGDSTVAAYAQMFRGHALLASGQPEEAASAYHHALTHWKEIDEEALVVETRAGLVRIAQEQGCLEQAWAHVECIYATLAGGATLYNAEEPFRIYLTCYQALHTCGDGRAQEIVEKGYARLQERARQIGDPTVRDSFLNNLPAHRLLLQAHAGASTP